MHMMFGHSIYARDRSKTMLTALNRVSVSAGYNTVRRFRQLLMDYTIKCAEKNNVPIPSNLNREDFTMGEQITPTIKIGHPYLEQMV